jgi:hypothetical protein
MRVVVGGLVVLVGVASTGCWNLSCEYQHTAGVARVTAIQAPSINGCSNGVDVVFDFTPSDGLKADVAATGVRLLVGGGLSPAKAWVEASGLSVGSDHPATRSDVVRGGCSPLEITLDDVDYRAGANACFAK